MISEATINAGDDIDSRCLKCKAVTGHTIIAMTSGTIAKVECNTCGARHNYRPPQAEKAKSNATRRRRDGVVVSPAKPKKAGAGTGKRVSRGALNFDALLKGKDEAAATPYSVEAKLTKGDLVKHTIFGLGVVMTTVFPNKAEVAFREHGSKLLICTLG